MPIPRRGNLARRYPGRRVRFRDSRHDSFERLVQRALDGLPQPFRQLLDNVAVVIDDEPTVEQLVVGDAAADGVLYGLYEGTPAIEYAADQVAFPNKISLFRLPLEEDFPQPGELAAEVQRTVMHELAHHAGIDEARLQEIGFD